MTQPIWKPHPVQIKALTTRAYEILFGGQRGGGKTDTGIVWLIEPKYIENPRYRALVLRKDSVDLGDWLDRAAYMYKGYGGSVVGNPSVIKFPSGAKIRTGHLKDRDSYEKYLGHEYQKILIEELTQIPQERYYVEILGSCRSTVEGLESQVMSTTNPGGKGHVWVKRRFVDPAQPGKEWLSDTGRTRVFIPAGVEDNPVLMERDPDYIKYLDGLQNTDKALYRAWRLGDWDAFEGQFFGKWNQAKHVKPKMYDLKYIPETFTLRLCWDEGTLKPRAVLLLVQDNDKKVSVVWEYYKTGEIAEDAARNIRKELEQQGVYTKLMKNGAFVYDPSMDIKSNQTGKSTASIVADILQIKPMPANNNRIEGWRRVKSYMSWSEFEEPMLNVWETCPNLIRTIPEMIYSQNNSEDLDTDLEDHSEDALRYGIMSLGELPERMKGEKKSQKLKPLVSTYKPQGGYQ